MKTAQAVTSILALSLGTCSAFVSQQAFAARSTAHASQLKMAIDLEAEPEGGEEIEAVDTMAGSRMKNMGIVDKKAEDGSDAFSFWMTAEADGQMIKKYRDQVSKDAAKNANFPGFRKGQIPPYAQPQMTMFALQEGIIKTCEAAVSAYGLVALSGSDGSVEVHEDVQEMVKGYKVGTSVQFTATFKASVDPEKQTASEEEETEEETVEETVTSED